jgi:hypothetical protein
MATICRRFAIGSGRKESENRVRGRPGDPRTERRSFQLIAPALVHLLVCRCGVRANIRYWAFHFEMGPAGPTSVCSAVFARTCGSRPILRRAPWIYGFTPDREVGRFQILPELLCVEQWRAGRLVWLRFGAEPLRPFLVHACEINIPRSMGPAGPTNLLFSRAPGLPSSCDEPTKKQDGEKRPGKPNTQYYHAHSRPRKYCLSV